MPILKHAKKKLKQDKKRELHNRSLKTRMKNLLKDAHKSKKADDVSKAVSAVDKAAKKNLLHKNKAAHIKSALAKAVAGTTAAAPAKKSPEKKAAPKKAVKSAAKKPAKAAGKNSAKK